MIAIIGVLVGIGIPTYQSSVRKANEAAAVGSLNSIRVAEAKYVNFYYMDPERGICFSKLGPATAADDTL